MAFTSSGSGSGYSTTNFTPAGDQSSYSIWLKTAQTTANVVPFSHCNNATQGGPSIIINNPSTGKYRLYAKEGGSDSVIATSTSSGVINDGNWHNIIILFDRRSGQVNQVYLDGVLDIFTTAAGNTTWAGAQISVGRSTDAFWTGLTGEHAYLAVWNGWLSASEIESIGVHRWCPALFARNRLQYYVPSFQALRQLWTPGGFSATIGSPGASSQPPVRGFMGAH